MDYISQVDNTERDEELSALRHELKLTRLLLRTIIDNLPSGIYAKDSDGRKILANKVDCRNVGVESEDELLGKTDFDFFPRHIAEQFYQDDLRVLRDGEAVIDREEQIVTEGGKQGWLLTSKIPLRDETGRIIGLVGFGHDITVEKELALKNKEVQQQIREQQNMIEKMILELSEVPRKISELVNSITYIANQTKMVSINAAIESARVGEHGRGFQIVADEVGRLSEQSGTAAKQVKEAINEVDNLVQTILQLWEEVRTED